MPKITVAIPIYNAEKYLKNCITSVVNQSVCDIQILLIDDGSTDKSGQICDTYAEKDLRIDVYHKENTGVSSARNFAITKAKGKYICFVDSDDEIDERMVEELYKYVENDYADIAICGHKSVYIGKKKGRIVKHVPPEFIGSTKEFLEMIEVFLNSESVQGPCGKLYKTSIIQNNEIKFPLEQSYGEDTIFVYRYLSFCNRVVSTTKCYYSYMKWNNNSLSSSIREDKINIYLKLHEELEELLNKFNISSKQGMIEKRICVSAISCIADLYTPNSNITTKQRRNIISNIILNERVLYCFSKHSNDNKQNGLMNYLAKVKLIWILEIYFNLKEFIRNQCGSVYALLKQNLGDN